MFKTALSTLFVVVFSATLVAQDSKSAPKVRKTTLKAVEGLRFEPARISAKRGEILELSFRNEDPNDQPHNFVLIKPGTLEDIQTASMVVGPDSMAKGFVPESEAVLSQSKLLNADERETLRIQLPDEKGIYPYVCTFPGHALVMYGALYVDVRPDGDIADDPNVPELVRNLEKEKVRALLEVERPSHLRLFMPNAGPAAIAVALPGDLNYCWDAGNCRLRYAWSGDFVDATRMWNSNGNSLGKLLGDEFWNSGGDEATFGLQIGDSPTQAVHFSGYSLKDGFPQFEYRVDETVVYESLTNRPEGLAWQFQIEAPSGRVRVLAPDSELGVITSDVGQREGDHWVVPQADAANFTLFLAKK